MRRLPANAGALLLVAALLAGCAANGGDDEGNGGSEEAPETSGTSGTSDGHGTRSGVPGPGETVDAFAVLEVQGALTGSGPEPEGRTLCDRAAPDGAIDLVERVATAKPGGHSFEAGRTWLVVIDAVRVEDPRVGGCGARPATPFTAEGGWTPQTRDRSLTLKVLPSAGGLLVGKRNITEDAPYAVDLSFEEGDYTFDGSITFVHHGWWPVGAFREEDVAPAFEDPSAVWWT